MSKQQRYIILNPDDEFQRGDEGYECYGEDAADGFWEAIPAEWYGDPISWYKGVYRRRLTEEQTKALNEVPDSHFHRRKITV